MDPFWQYISECWFDVDPDKIVADNGGDYEAAAKAIVRHMCYDAYHSASEAEEYRERMLEEFDLTPKDMEWEVEQFLHYWHEHYGDDDEGDDDDDEEVE